MRSPGAEERRWLSPCAVAAILLAAALPYLPTLGFGFLGYDDPLLITGEVFWQTPSLAAVGDLLTRPVAGSYHPLHQLSYLLDRVVWGPTPLGVRVTQVVLHVACAGLVLLVARRLGLSAVASAVAGLAFAWHPAHVENVAWASQRKDLLSAAFALGAVAAYLGPRGRGPERAGSWALVLGCFTLGLLSKSVAVVSLPILCALSLRLGRARQDAGWLGALLALGLIAARVHYLAQAEVGTVVAGLGGGERARLVLRALAIYVEVGIAPFWPSPQSPPTPVSGPGDLLAALLVLGALGAGAWWWWTGRRRRGVLVAWFFAALLPTSGIVPFVTFVQERYLLLASAALALLAGDLLAGAKPARRRAALLLAAVGLVALATVSGRYALAWRDDVSVWSWAVVRRPDDPAALAQLAGALADAGRLMEAEATCRRSLTLAPTLQSANQTLGALLLSRGAVDEARRHLTVAASGGGVRGTTAALRLCLLEVDQGDLTAAERALEAAERSAPAWAPEVRATRAQLRLLTGGADEAARLLREAVARAPGWQDAWERLAHAERLAGREDEARAAAERATPAGRALVLALLELDRGETAAAEEQLRAAGPPTIEGELVRARLEVARGEHARARDRLAALERRGGRGATLRAALEPDLRPLLAR
jgi:tetratricopeptide (TPR) repeat protein